MSKYITDKQFCALVNLGCNDYLDQRYSTTVDEAIDWIRRKFNVMIFDATEPYVDPIEKKIKYAYRVKFCNKTWGWNQRERIGQTKWSNDSYAAKRTAIWIAIRYINRKKKDAERRRQSANRRRGIRNSNSRKRTAILRPLRD